MITEILATLAGHPSSLFSSSTASSSRDRLPRTHLEVRQDLAYLHPSEVHILNTLVSYSSRYVRIKQFATHQIQHARKVAIRSALRVNSMASSASASVDGDKQITLHMVPLCSTLLSILQQYHALVLKTERDVLAQDADLVADHGFVSLANIRARFEPWDASLTALDDLVSILAQGPAEILDSHSAAATASPSSAEQGQGQGQPNSSEQGPGDSAKPLPPPVADLQVSHLWTGGLLIDLLTTKASTGVERVAKCMTSLRDAVQDSWMAGLVAWVCHGEVLTEATLASSKLTYRGPPTKDQLVEWHHDDETDLSDSAEEWVTTSDTWRLRKHALPKSISPATAESILYVGRALNTVRTSNRTSSSSSSSSTAHATSLITAAGPVSPPDSLTAQHVSLLRQSHVRPSRSSELDRAIQEIRSNVSEWLFRNVLTTDLVLEALETLGNYFLLRSGTFSLSLLSELDAMSKHKLLNARSAAANVIRASDMELAMLRASVGTTAEDDPTLAKLRFVLPKTGSSRPTLADRSDDPSQIHIRPTTSKVRFDDLLIGVPAQLHYTATFPLDLFLSPSDLSAYSRLFSYLVALKKVHSRVLGCWTSLSNSQRVRRKFTGTGEGGIDRGEEKQRTQLLRTSWGLTRDMLWFLDTLLGHFQTDIIDVQYTRLIEQLQTNRIDVNVQRQQQPTGLSSISTAQVTHSDTSSLGKLPRFTPKLTQEVSVNNSPATTSTTAATTRSKMLSIAGSTATATPSTIRAASVAPPFQVGGRWGHPSSIRGTNTAATAIIGESGSGSVQVAGINNPAAGGGGDLALDFASLRSTHTSFLTFIQDGSLLTSPTACSIIHSILDLCLGFSGVLELWNGDVLPSLLSDSSNSSTTKKAWNLDQRSQNINQTKINLKGLFFDFFLFLSQSSSSDVDVSVSVTTENKIKADVAARKHLEQLLLRLDFNNHFTR